MLWVRFPPELLTRPRRAARSERNPITVAIVGRNPNGHVNSTRYANWQSDEVESLVPVGSTPTSVTDNGRLVQREDAWPATRRSGFDSPAGPLNTQGSRIRLAGPVC